MKNKEFSELPMYEKQMINNTLGIVSDFMDNENRREYRKRLLKSINKVYFRSSNERIVAKRLEENNALGESKGVINKNIGSVITKKENMFKSTIYIDDTKTDDNLTIEKTLLHEMNHADTRDRGFVSKLVRYNGFITRDISHIKTTGVAFNEALNELYTQLMFYNEHKDIYQNVNSFDDILYKPIIPEGYEGKYKSNSMYSNLILLAKLLVIVSDNNLGTSYDLLDTTKEDFLSKQVYLHNGSKTIKNDLLYAGKYNPKGFKDHFDMITSDGKFEELLDSFDIVFDDMYKTPHTKDYQKNIDKTNIYNIINIIDEYKVNKFRLYTEDGLWSKYQKRYYEALYHDYTVYLSYKFGLDVKKVNERDRILKLNCKEGN